MLLKHKSIAIIGGGPGGLTLARLLQLKRVKITVYERDRNKDARVQGSPLDLHETSGLAALREAGLIDEFQRNFMPGADRKLITNERAEVFFSDHETKQEENFGDAHFRPEIDRGVLRKILLESLQPGTIVWNSHFVSMDRQDEGWLLHFKNGVEAYADMVIAADGANSKIRPYLTDIKPFYSGITMLEGNIRHAEQAAPQMFDFLKGGKIMAFGNEQDLLMGQNAGGELGFYASFKAAENWAASSGLDFSNKVQVLDWFHTTYPDWAPIWSELFESSEMPFIPRPIYCIPFDQTWNALPNLTMIGDAAHVMPPFAGEGVNMAMLDALELCTSLTEGKHNTTLQAISFFEDAMRKRAAVVAKESMENGERMHDKDALETMLGFFNGH